MRLFEFCLPPPVPKAPYPAAHRAHFIFKPIHGQIFVPEVFGFVDGFQ